MLHKLSSATNEGQRYLCLAKAVDMFNGGNLIRWYDFSSVTLEDVIRAQATGLKSTNGKSSGADKLIPTTFIKRMLRQLLLGLDCLHKQGITHRNLKPKHILVKNSEAIGGNKNRIDLSRSWIEIADFSKACISSFPSELQEPTTSRAGSLWYRSPEILLGDERYGISADIWSVGCVFAYIVRGGVPLFTGCSEIEQLLLIFSLLGSPSSESWEKFKALPTFDKHTSLFWQKGGLRTSVPELDNEGVNLLQSLLELNPNDRTTTSSALKHNFLQKDTPNREKLGAIASKGHPKPRESQPLSLYQERASSLKSFESFSLKLQPSRNHAHHDQWATIVDWVIEIIDVFDKSIRTAFLAMTYFDNFISNIKRVKTRKYQLIAATCLHIASKCEDAESISVADLVFCADNTFSERDIIELEKVILNQIGWKLSYPLICDFVCLYVELTPEVKSNSKTLWLAKYLCELALQSNLYLSFQASAIAACTVSLALHATDQSNAWPQSLEVASGLNWSDLGDCMVALSQSIENTRRTLPRLKMITRRYRKKDRACVAEITIPTIRSQADFSVTS
uniref:Cyclin-dependent kinase 2 homolog n=2 Tax=Ditylum brightwellii TaxID=49249 RepID=A0A7S1VZA2_9STRA|mmetsp:Transcript_10691/g.15903  ORF Transcript_10691/g.15903 Transcript_10691/m.15903 type:complete len:565 (+) Transcript_10691:424-2118(+)